MALFGGGAFSSAVQRINYPMHKGAPNPAHGKFFIVGSIPLACYDEAKGRSKHYDSEQEAIDALIAAGADRIQRVDCSFAKGK